MSFSFWPKRLSGNARGIVLILLASVFAVASSSLTKTLSDTFPSIQIAWVRALVTLVCLVPFVIRDQFRGLWPNRPILMGFRSLNAGAIILLNIYAVGNMPLVDFTAIGFTTPIFVILLSLVILRTQPRLDRSLATLVGFVGVMVIVRPTATLSPAFAAAIGGAFCLGLGLVLVRLLSKSESQLRLLLWSNALLALLIAWPAVNAWKSAQLLDGLMLIVAGVAGMLTQATILLAYQAGEPTIVAPFDYSRILIAIAAGFFIFGELPDALTFLGAALVIGAGLFIARKPAA